MKITPVQGAGAIKDLSTPEHVRTARAVEAFNKGAPLKAQANTTPVADPNQVSVEELGAIQAPQTTDESSNTEDTQEQEVLEVSPETPVEPKVEDKPKDTPASRQWAQLARQERALRAKAQAQEQAYKAREDALKAKEAELSAKDNQYRDGYISRDRLKSDTLAALAEAEVSYDEITQQILNQQPANPRMDAHISRLEAKIAQLEEANKAAQTTAEQRQQDSYKAAVKQIESDTKNLIKQDPNAYEAIAKTGSIKDVVDLIEQTWHKDGVLLSVEEAATEVENYLVEEGVNTVTRIEKIKKRLAQSNASTTKADAKTQATKTQTQSGMKTLTNATASTRQLSAKERAILAFKGELKS